MKRFIPRRRKSIVLVALLVLGIAAGSAYAAWTLMNVHAAARAHNGSLTGSVSVDNAASTADVGDMFPGGPAGSIVAKITNNSGVPMKLVAIHGTAITFDSDSPAACPNASWVWAGDQTFDTPIDVPTGISIITVPPSAFTTGGVKLLGSAPNGCQNIGVLLGGSFFYDFTT